MLFANLLWYNKFYPLFMKFCWHWHISGNLQNHLLLWWENPLCPSVYFYWWTNIPTTFCKRLQHFHTYFILICRWCIGIIDAIHTARYGPNCKHFNGYFSQKLCRIIITIKLIYDLVCDCFSRICAINKIDFGNFDETLSNIPLVMSVKH